MSASLAFLKVDARRPLDEDLDRVSDVNDAKARGFIKLQARLAPLFTKDINDYTVSIAPGATHVNVMATSFTPGLKILIDGTPGNMALRDARVGSKIVIELVDAQGNTQVTYTLKPTCDVSMTNDGEIVMKEKPNYDAGETHGHSHDGVPCDGSHHSHGHGHGHGHEEIKKEEKCEHDHGSNESCHGHGQGEENSAGSHGHGHGHHH